MHTPIKTNVFEKRMTGSRRYEILISWVFRIATYFILACASYIFLDIITKGVGVLFDTKPPFINIPFLVESPETLHVFEYKGEKYEIGEAKFREFMKAEGASDSEFSHYHTYAYSGGGIFPQIVGTILLVTGSILIALFFGVLCAIYLSEYSNRGKFISIIRLSIVNLAGVPSIVFGLFGYAMFVLAFGWGTSMIAGWFTLAFMVLPIVITASEESLRAVPQGFREASLALGATKWQSIRTNVLPYATPGILTSSVLGITRVAGETAPIMFTAAVAHLDTMPWEELPSLAEVDGKFWEVPWDFVTRAIAALPYHIYVVAAKLPDSEYTRAAQYGTCFVFMIVVFLIALASILLRARIRKNLKW